MVEDAIASQRQQVQEARRLVEQRKAEAKQARESISETREKLPQRKSQTALRQRMAGLKGRQQRRDIKRVESKLGQKEQEVSQFEKELSSVEGQVKQSEQAISDYDERQAAIRQVQKAIANDKVWLLSAYGEGYVKKYAKDYLEQRNLAEENRSNLLANPEKLDAAISKLTSKGLTQEQALSKLGLEIKNIPEVTISKKTGDLISYSGLSTQQLYTPAPEKDLRVTKLQRGLGVASDLLKGAAESTIISAKVIKESQLTPKITPSQTIDFISTGKIDRKSSLQQAKIGGDILLKDVQRSIGRETRNVLESLPTKKIIEFKEGAGKRVEFGNKIIEELNRPDITESRRNTLINQYKTYVGNVREIKTNGETRYEFDRPEERLRVRGKEFVIPSEEFIDKGVTGTTLRLFEGVSEESFKQISEKVLPKDKSIYFISDPSKQFNILAPQSFQRESKLTPESVGKGVGLFTRLATYTPSVLGDLGESTFTRGEFGAPKGTLEFIKRRPEDVAVIGLAGGISASKYIAKDLGRTFKLVDKGERIDITKTVKTIKSIGEPPNLNVPQRYFSNIPFGSQSIYSGEVVEVIYKGERVKMTLKEALSKGLTPLVSRKAIISDLQFYPKENQISAVRSAFRKNIYLDSKSLNRDRLKAIKFLKEANIPEPRIREIMFEVFPDLKQLSKSLVKRDTILVKESVGGLKQDSKQIINVVESRGGNLQETIPLRNPIREQRPAESVFSGLGRYEQTSDVSLRFPATSTRTVSLTTDVSSPDTISITRQSLLDIQSTNQRSDLGVKQSLKLFQRTEQKPDTISITDNISKQKSLTESKSTTLLKTRQTQESKTKQVFKDLLKQRTKQETKVKQKDTFKKLLPKQESKTLKTTSKDKVESIFKVFTRKGKQDIEVGKAKTREEAFELLGEELKGSLRASGFVSRGGDKVKPISFGTEFRASKSDPFRVVERKEKRLRRGTTGKQIQFFRGTKGSNRGFL